MASTKENLRREGINIGGDLNVYGDFIAPGAKKEVTFTGGKHYHGMPAPSQESEEEEDHPADEDKPQPSGEDKGASRKANAGNGKRLSEEKSLTERLMSAIAEMVGEQRISKKQEFAALYKITCEKIIPGIKQGEFCRIVCDMVNLPAELQPSDDNLRRVYFSGHDFPEWRITGFSTEKTVEYVKLARLLLQKLDL